MEKLNQSIENIIVNIINKVLSILNLKSYELLYFILYITLIFVVKIVANLLKKPLKFYLFKRRKESYYRYLFYRVDKIFKPIIYFLYLHFLTKAIFILYKIDENSDIYIILYVVKIVLILWSIYEIIKYLIYATIRNKIKSQKIARRELFNLLLNISKIVLFLVAIVLIFSKLGVDITALITSLGIGGAIIGFSAKDTLVNFFDSIRLVSEDAFRQGDWIETRDIEGFVTEIGLTSTKIRTFDNAMVTIPNSRLANDYVKNWTKRVIGRRIKFYLPIKFTANTVEIDRVIHEIYEMLHSHPDIVNLNKIKYLKKMTTIFEDGLFNIEDKYGVRRTLMVYLDSIDKYSLSILVYAFSISVNWEEWLRVKQDIIKKIVEIVEASELEFAYPTQEILLKNLD